MTHLTADELKSWFEHGKAADRERVIAHLADCNDCRKALSALAMSAEAEPSTSPLTMNEAVALGYDAHKPETIFRPAMRLRPLYGLAAAAVIVVAVLWITSPTLIDQGEAVRNRIIRLSSPTGVGNAQQFEWESPLRPARFRVTVRDANGVLVLSGETASSPFRTDAAARSPLKAGEGYSWKVEALNESGEVIGGSVNAAFKYQP